jgi:alcohol dehydrogenase (cytochrome c)
MWLGLSAVGICVIFMGILAFSLAVPRYRWRVDVVYLKARGQLTGITWRELYHLNQHGDPFNLKGLVETRSAYLSIRDPFASPADVSAGEKLFQSNCSACHGSKGLGGLHGPSLYQRQMVMGNSDWALFKTITNGIEGTGMPPNPLPENVRWRLVAYVKSLAEGAAMHSESPAASRIATIPAVRYEDIRDSKLDDGQWLTYSGTYNAERFSANDEITKANVSHLRLVWMHQYSADSPLETSPLVVDGFMFVTVPPNRVEALDAKTGELIWSYNRSLPGQLSVCCGSVNRGLAVLGNTLFLGTLDAHLVALDMKTGAVKWDSEIADHKQGYSITSAPLALKNMVVTGVSGGEYGIRGFVSARDAATGKELWRFDTIPRPGEPAANTWEKGSLETGGGPTWLTGTFDPELNMIYWPVGNPSPDYEGDSRQGDNLYTDSVVALDADHGTLRWYFQFTPHDQYDWDGTETLIAFDGTINGKRRRLLGQADRNAFYYLLDRENGHFITAQPFAKQTWAKEIDSNGRPVMNPDAVPKPQGTTVYPSVAGATNWMSPSYSPMTGLFYVPVTEAGGDFSTTSSPAYHAGDLFLGGASQIFTNPPQQAGVGALDPLTGKMRWEYRYTSWSAGGLLSTRGGIVFAGLGQMFLALDANSGRELWHVDTGGMVRAAPVTYSLDGVQYVTIAAGSDLLTFEE